MENIHQMLPLL